MTFVLPIASNQKWNTRPKKKSDPKKRSRLTRFGAASAAIVVLLTPFCDETLANLTSNTDNPSAMGPFFSLPAEDLEATAPQSFSRLNRLRTTYLANKSEVLRALKNCTTSPINCSSEIKAYQEEVERIKKIQDPFLKIENIEIWFNTLLTYNQDEVDHQLPHLTAVETLRTKHVVCDEFSQLKLITAELTGVENAHYIEEIHLKNGKYKSMHAVVEVNVNGRNWVMTNNHLYLWPDAHITWSMRNYSTISISTLERDRAQLNIDGSNRFLPKGEVYYPLSSFNRQDVRLFPEGARIFENYRLDQDAPTKILAFNEGEHVRSNPATRALNLSELSRHYNIITATMKSAMALRFN